jgi:hypothetical protein
LGRDGAFDIDHSLGDSVEGVPLKCLDTSGIRHACTIGIEFDAVPAEICFFRDEIKSDSLPTHGSIPEAGSGNTSRGRSLAASLSGKGQYPILKRATERIDSPRRHNPGLSQQLRVSVSGLTVIRPQSAAWGPIRSSH